MSIIDSIREVALTTVVGNLPVVAVVGIITILMLLATGVYGIGLLKGRIKGGSIIFHRNLGIVTGTIALIHAILALSIFL
jgi:hypothetical protein